MGFKIKHSLIGKSIKESLKDGKKDRLECHLLTHWWEKWMHQDLWVIEEDKS
jgi:hypothetical protein